MQIAKKSRWKFKEQLSLGIGVVRKHQCFAFLFFVQLIHLRAYCSLNATDYRVTTEKLTAKLCNCHSFK